MQSFSKKTMSDQLVINWAFDSTFERQGDFIHLPVEIYRKNGPRSAGHSLGFASRKTKIPANLQARRRHGYILLVHDTSQSEYYKGATRPVLRWSKAGVELGHETTANRDSHQFIHTGGYSSQVQLKPAWQRYIASP